MEQSLYWTVNKCSACKILCVLWNPEVHYCIHKSMSLNLIVSHTNPAHTLPPYFLKTQFNVTLPPLQDLQRKFCMHFSSLPCVLHAPSILS
jgi:hypothetical protein